MGFSLNPQQEEILRAGSNRFVKAGAGTGKTRTIVELYADLLLERNLEVRNILAITFTEKAAGEMKERIMEKIEQLSETGVKRTARLKSLRHRISYAWISTIHSFCARILREFPLESGLDPSFEIISPGEQRSRVSFSIRKFFNQEGGSSQFDRLRDIAVIYRYDSMVKLFHEALMKKRFEIKNLDFDTVQYKTADDESGKRLLRSLPQFKNAFDQMLAIYHNENMKENKLDYSQLINHVNGLLEHHAVIRDTLCERFRYLIVDEFQDTNEEQKRIIDHLSSKESKTVFVGDAKQSIYLFNGADVGVFNRTFKRFKADESFELFLNYRSASSLIDFFNSFFARVFEEEAGSDSGEDFMVSYDKLEAGAEKGVVAPVKLLPVADDFHEECDNIARYILSRVDPAKAAKDPLDFRDCAVLLRRMSKVETLSEAFERYHIPYLIIGNKSFFRRPEVATLTAFARALYDPADEQNLLYLLRSYISPLSDDDLVELRRYDKHSLFSAWEQYTEKDARAADFYNQFLALRSLMNVTSPKDLIRRIIENFDYDILLSRLDNPEKRLLNLKKFQEYTASFEGDSSVRRFVTKLEESLMDNESEASVDSEKSNVVRVMTIHKSKGLEFPVVIVPELGYSRNQTDKPFIINDFNRNTMAFKNPAAKEQGSEYDKLLHRENRKEAEEEKRILYVAMTRAERNVVLSYSEPKKGKKNARFRNALIRGGLLKEESAGDSWNVDHDDRLSRYIESVERKTLSGIEPLAVEERAPSFDIQIPRTVFEMEEDPWKKYLSPSLLNETGMNKDEITYRAFSVLRSFENDREDEVKNKDKKTIGTLVHKVLEDLGRMKLDDFTDEWVEKKLKRELYSEKALDSVLFIMKQLRENKPMLLKRIENAEVVYSEVPFRRRFGDYILTGTVDKIFRFKGEWVIVDFKYTTQKTNPDYAFQVQFYLFGLKHLLKPAAQSGYLQYLGRNIQKKIVLPNNFEETLKKKIELFEGETSKIRDL